MKQKLVWLRLQPSKHVSPVLFLHLLNRYREEVSDPLLVQLLHIWDVQMVVAEATATIGMARTRRTHSTRGHGMVAVVLGKVEVVAEAAATAVAETDMRMLSWIRSEDQSHVQLKGMKMHKLQIFDRVLYRQVG